MALSDSEKKILREAGSDRDPVSRQQAVGIVFAKQGEDADEARELLTQGYLEHVSPSFHLVPRGDSMFAEDPFTEAYAALAEGTDNFADVSSRSLATTLLATPAALAPLRMILGLTHNELAFAIRLQVPDSRVGGGRLKNFERDPPPRRLTAARERLVDSIAEAVLAMMKRELLPVPPRAAGFARRTRSALPPHQTGSEWRCGNRGAIRCQARARLRHS